MVDPMIADSIRVAQETDDEVVDALSRVMTSTIDQALEAAADDNWEHPGITPGEDDWKGCRYETREMLRALTDTLGFRVVKLAPVGADSIGWVITDEWRPS